MQKFEGLFATPITPFDENENIYEEGIRNVVNFVYSKGINNLFCLGSWGGFALMNINERMRVAEVLISECKKNRMNIIINIVATSTRDACMLAKHAQDHGADAIASLVPYYYSSSGYNNDNYLDYFSTIIDSVNIPVHFYNNPRTTGYVLTMDLFNKLLDIGVSGMKEGGGNLAAFIEMMHIIENRKIDFDMIPGSVTMLLPALLYGVKATMVGSAVVFPELAVNAYNAFTSGDVSLATKLHAKLMEIRIIQGSRGMGSAACYALLKQRGIDAGMPRRPWRGLSVNDLESIVERLRTAEVSL
jgi:dihydrodipicolinate synthase/N-acetylneuraminate lyase